MFYGKEALEFMQFDNILYQVQDNVLYLTLNRPDVRNALSPEMWRDIQVAVTAAGSDPEIKVVIISGKGGKALAGGADIREIHNRDYMKQMDGTATITLKMLEDLYKPVICAINGYALGGGCELAMACDIRIATRRSKFGQPETGLGIIPGAGGTQRLVRLVGPGKAKELIFTGRIITAEEAASIGLVNQVTEDDEDDLMHCARDMAAQIMRKGPVATSMAKLCINLGSDTDMGTGLMIERLAQTIVFSTEDRKEGTAAFLEKRSANFQGK